MKDEILKGLEDIIKINQNRSIEFKRLYGFTFVFTKNIITVNEKLSSAEITPIGIIYDENDQYYFAPLKDIDNLEEIVEEFVKTL